MIDIESKLDDMLAAWHRYTAAYRAAKGHATRDSTCRDFRAPTHWDWLNGAQDEHTDKELMRLFDEAVQKVPNHPRRWHTALAFQARNLATGYQVWHSPVLPRGEELEVLILEARNRLMRELRGVLA